MGGELTESPSGHSDNVIPFERSYYKGDGSKRAQRFDARMTDGSSITIWHQDLGESVWGIDSEGYLYPAYTSQFICDKFSDLSQVDSKLATDSGDVMRFRMTEGLALLESYGVDVSSIEFVETKR